LAAVYRPNLFSLFKKKPPALGQEVSGAYRSGRLGFFLYLFGFLLYGNFFFAFAAAAMAAFFVAFAGVGSAAYQQGGSG
jgi:hypothetical protein